MEGARGLGAGSLRSKKDALQNAGIKSTQLMPWRVNTTHTMGVDVIDKTVGRGGGGENREGDDPLTQNHWNGEEDMQSRPYKNSLEFGLKTLLASENVRKKQ